jgi:hypothetical protein
MNHRQIQRPWPLIAALWLLASCSGGSSEGPDSTRSPTPPTQWDQGNWDQLTWQ